MKFTLPLQVTNCTGHAISFSPDLESVFFLEELLDLLDGLEFVHECVGLHGVHLLLAVTQEKVHPGTQLELVCGVK